MPAGGLDPNMMAEMMKNMGGAGNGEENKPIDEDNPTVEEIN